MGRKIYDEDLRLNLILNGAALNKGSVSMVAALGKLEQKLVGLEQEARETAAKLKLLNKDAVNNAVAIKDAEKHYNKLVRAMNATSRAIQDMRTKVGLAGMTLQQLRNHLTALRAQLYNMPGSVGSPMFQRLQNEIRATEVRIRTLTTGASRLAQAWERLEKAANRAGTVIGWSALIIYGIVRVVSGVVRRMKELEDLVGTTRKNTNLLVGEVWEMKDAFDQWDTRTKTDDLMKLAIVAGKLGLEGKEKIMKFVDAANMIQIALGDDLNGSVEDTVTSIGKLMAAFRIDKKMPIEEALVRTGDVLNDLAKSSAASAGTILEYMVRLSAVGELAGFTIDQIGGLGSTLDALHVPSERGATALQKIMLQLANPKKISAFAEAMGMVNNEAGTMSEQYINLLKHDPNKVLTTLLTKFVSTKEGLSELTGGLQEFGVRGQYMTAVLGSLALNLDVLSQQQEVSFNAWTDHNSVMNEYMIMNNNFTAQVEKQQKSIRKETDHMKLEAEPAVIKLITAWARFVTWIRQATDWIGRHWTLIKAFTFAYIALNFTTVYRISLLINETIVAKYLIVVRKLEYLWTLALILSNKSLTWEQYAQVRSSVLLTFAHKSMARSLRATWIELKALVLAGGGAGVVFSAVTGTVLALAAAFYFLAIKKRALTDAEKADLEVRQKIREDYFTEKGVLDILIDQLKDKNTTEKARGEIIQEIVDRYGDYLPLLREEGLTADKVVASYEKLIEVMGTKILRQNLMEAAGKNNVKLEESKAIINDLDAQIKEKTDELNKPQNKLKIWGTNDIQEKINDLNRRKEREKKVYQELYDLQTKYASDLKKAEPPNLINPMTEEDLKAAVEQKRDEFSRLLDEVVKMEERVELKKKTWPGDPNLANDEIELQKKQNLLTKMDNDLTKLDYKLKKVRDMNDLAEIMKNNEPAFLVRQAERDIALERENTRLTELAAQQLKTEEWKDKEIKKARLNFLNDTIADIEKSGKVFDKDEKQWLDYRKERAEILIDLANGKKGKGSGVNKAALKEIEDLEEEYAKRQRKLAQDYAAGEVGDKQDYEDQKIQIEKEKDDKMLVILTKYNLKRSDVINDQAENEIAILSKNAAKEIDDNNQKYSQKRQAIADQYAKNEISGKEYVKGLLLQIEKEQLEEEMAIYEKNMMSKAALIKKQGELEIKIRENNEARAKEILVESSQATETWYKEEERKLKQKYVDDINSRENFNDELIKLEMAKLTMYQSLLLVEMEYGQMTVEAYTAAAKKVEEIGEKLLDLNIQLINGGKKESASASKELNKELGQRKSYFSKVFLLKQEEKKFLADDKNTAEQKQAYSKQTQESIEALSEAEAIAFAESTMAAVDNAQSFQESTVIILNAIRSKIQAYLAESIAAAIAKEIGTKGLVGVITAGIAAGAVMTLFNALIPKFELTASGSIGTSTFGSKKKAAQKAGGSYPVLGADDGRVYDAVYGGNVRTGVYSRPTLLNMSGGPALVGEKAPELVVDGATFRRIQLNSPGLLKDIYAYAGRGGLPRSARNDGVNQKSAGQYPTGEGANGRLGEGATGRMGDGESVRLRVAIEKLNGHLDKGIAARINKYGTNGLIDGLNDITKFNAKIGR